MIRNARTLTGLILSVAFLCGVSTATPAAAGLYTDDLARCLVSSAKPEDREALIRWMFGMMAANPKIKDMARLTEGDSEALSKQAAQLFQRLMLTDCHQQTLDAVKYDGPNAIQTASETLGRIAMGDLMSAPETVAYMGRLDGYLDREKWEAFRKATGRAVDVGVRK